jgi:hypothetical protein
MRNIISHGLRASHHHAQIAGQLLAVEKVD